MKSSHKLIGPTGFIMIGILFLIGFGDACRRQVALMTISDDEINLRATIEAAEDVASVASTVNMRCYWEVPENNQSLRNTVHECSSNSKTKFERLIEALYDMKNDYEPNPIRLKRIQEQVSDLGQETINNAAYCNYTLEPYQQRRLNFHREFRIQRNVITRNFAANRKLIENDKVEDEKFAEKQKKVKLAKKAAAVAATKFVNTTIAPDEESLTTEEQKEVKLRLAKIEKAFADPNLDDDGFKERLKEAAGDEWETVYALLASKHMHYHLQREAGLVK